MYRVAADRYETVRDEYERVKGRMKEEGMDLADFAKLVSSAASTLELDLPPTRDIVMDGPFDRPDEYYLARQRKAYGQTDTPLDD